MPRRRCLRRSTSIIRITKSCSASLPQRIPSFPLVKKLMADNPPRGARLLIGDDRVSPNPKLNNVVKGWRAARHDWIVIADSNVLMPRDYIERLFASWRDDTGLVASPPIGCRPDGFWAEVECAFLNTYQARWQYIVDTFGFGFAQGKTMLWRRADLDAAGGIEALGKEVAEDAAATKVVRGAGSQSAAGRSAVCATARPAQRRRSLESPIALGAAAAGQLPAVFPAGGSLRRHTADDRRCVLGRRIRHCRWRLCVAAFAALWYGAEMALAAAAGWHVSPLSPLYGLFARSAAAGTVRRCAARQRLRLARQRNAGRAHAAQRRRIIARVRPRVREFATGSRRRLRSLRERMSS